MSETTATSAEAQGAWPVYRRLLGHAWVYWPFLLVAMVAMVIEALAGAAFVWLMEPLTNDGFVDPNPEMAIVLPLAIVGLFLLRGMATFATDYGMARVGRSVVRDLRELVLAKYLRLPSVRFDTEAVPAMVSRLNFDTEQVTQASSDALKAILTDDRAGLRAVAVSDGQTIGRAQARFAPLGPGPNPHRKWCRPPSLRHCRHRSRKLSVLREYPQTAAALCHEQAPIGQSLGAKLDGLELTGRFVQGGHATRAVGSVSFDLYPGETTEQVLQSLLQAETEADREEIRATDPAIESARELVALCEEFPDSSIRFNSLSMALLILAAARFMGRAWSAELILLAAAPCTAMVFVWSRLTQGDPYFTLSQVALNDAIMVVAFAPIVALLLGLSSIVVPWETLLVSVLLYIVIPVAIAQGWRWTLLRGGEARLQRALAAIQPLSTAALLATIVLLFAFQGRQLLAQPLIIAMLAVPILVQVYLNSGLAYLLNRRLKVAHAVAGPSALIGASNFCELAVAAAITLFGFESGAALATVVGVLVEVPVMLSVVAIVNRSRRWYEAAAA